MYNFTITFNQSGKKPLYEQLYEYIAGEIRAKRILEKEKMPSKKALSAHLGISVNTVETAYSLLVQEGYLCSVPRSGYYVCKIEAPIADDVQILNKPDLPKESYIADFRTNAVDSDAFPFSTWAKLSKEVMSSSPEFLNLGSPQGDYELRTSIAKYLHEFRGVKCTPEQIIVGAGIEYLTMILVEILGRNTVFAVENPGYRKTCDIIKNSGNRVNYINVDNDGMIVDELKDSDSDVVCITPSHQFPTGAIMPVGRRLELISWANEAENRYIIEDDYNSEFNFSVKPVPAVQGLVAGSRVIYMSTFSRILAPSIRIAYMVLPMKLLDIFKSKFSSYSSTVSRFEQQTLNKFISGGYLQRHLNRVKIIYRKRRDFMLAALKKLPYRVEVYGEAAGLHLLIKTDKSQKIIKAAEKGGIKLYKLDDYYFGKCEKTTNTLILGYASCSEADVKLLIDIISEL